MEWKVYEQSFIEKSKSVFEWLDNEYSKLRSGRITSSVLDHIKVDAYGELTPIANVANISSPEARVLIIKPYDASLNKNIAGAINASDLGVNPQVDGDKIRLSFPALTEDVRKETVKKAKSISEEAKIRIRKVRQAIHDDFRKDELSDDDKKYYVTCLDKVTKEQNEKIEKSLSSKSDEIMKI
ncbi:MAG: ribosome recycling factor [Mycoplasma sp.]